MGYEVGPPPLLRPALTTYAQGLAHRTIHYWLVVPPLGDQKRREIDAYAAERNVELLEWPKLIREMISFIEVGRNARNSTDHVLRVLKNYGFLDPQGNS